MHLPMDAARAAVPTDAPNDPIEWLYRRHYGGLLAWLRRKLGHSGHAADLAQDTFVRMLVRPAGPSLAELREPIAYLRTVANGLLVDHWRRQALEQAYLDALAAQGPSFEPSPEERAVIFDALERIARLLDGFKPKVRAAFLMAQIEGMPHGEIADRMGVSTRTVERYVAEGLFRCHCALRDGGPA